MMGDTSAFQLVLSGDPTLFAIVRLSLFMSLSAVLFATLIGMPFGALMALTRFPGRESAIVVINASMARNSCPGVIINPVRPSCVVRSRPRGAP